jgi:hypothetical protein
MDLDDSYDELISHANTVYTMVVLDGRTKVVKNRFNSGPAKLWAIERLIESLMADVDRWQRELPRTP